MVNRSRGRKAGIVGMVGALLWAVGTIMQNWFGLWGEGSGLLYTVHQLLAFTALTCMIIGFLGLIWGGAVVGRFGKTAVYLYAAAYGLIILAGLVGLISQTQDSPIFILYPIGGLLSTLSALLISVAVLRAKRWQGWQLWMPLASFLIIFLAVDLPLFLGVTDGPGLVGELIMAACWFGVGLAVFTKGGVETAVPVPTPAA